MKLDPKNYIEWVGGTKHNDGEGEGVPWFKDSTTTSQWDHTNQTQSCIPLSYSHLKTDLLELMWIFFIFLIMDTDM